MALGTQMGFPGISNWIDPRRRAILGFAAGLAGGQTPQQGIAMGLQGAAAGREADDAFALQQKAEQERQAQLNQTVEWARRMFPEQLANVPEHLAGDLAVDLWKQQFTGGGGNDATFGLTPIYGVGPDGQPTIAQLSNQGGLRPVDLPEGFNVAKDPIRMDAGTHFVLLDPVTRQQIGIIPKEVRAEAAEAAAGTVEGRTAAEREVQAPIQEANLQRLDAQTDNVIETIDKATGQAAWDSTGLVGQVLGGIAGTKAFDLRETAKTIKANLGFAELQAMRDASPTGGALGQVAIQELEALQSTLASLNPDQSEDQLRQNLMLVRELLERQKQYRRMAAEAKFGVPAPAAPAAPAGGVDDILSGYGL